MMWGKLEFVLINGDRYLDDIKRHLDGLKSEFYHEYEIYNCRVAQRKELMTFIINQDETFSVVEVETGQSSSLFNVNEELIEDFIFGIIASSLQIYCGGILCIIDSVLGENTSRCGNFYLTNMKDKIVALGAKEVFFLVERNCETGILDVCKYIEEVESSLDADSVITYNYLVNVELEEHSKEKVYLYIKDKL